MPRVLAARCNLSVGPLGRPSKILHYAARPYRPLPTITSSGLASVHLVLLSHKDFFSDLETLGVVPD
jgi:hypothetical protein